MTNFWRLTCSQAPDGALSPWEKDLPNIFSIFAKRTRLLAQQLAKTPELLHMHGKILSERTYWKGEWLQHSPGALHLSERIQTPSLSELFMTAIASSYANTQILTIAFHVGWPTLSEPSVSHTVLLRFRQNPYAFSADIEKAFLHVQLDKLDRDYTGSPTCTTRITHFNLINSKLFDLPTIHG